MPRRRSVHSFIAITAGVLLIGAFVVDGFSVFADRAVLWIAGYYLAAVGIGVALAAAVAGVAEHVRSRRAHPPLRRVALHAGVNFVAVAGFALAWWLRGTAEIPPDPGLVVIQAVAALFLLAGSWIGVTTRRRRATAARV
jgi:hypothetical protein